MQTMDKGGVFWDPNFLPPDMPSGMSGSTQWTRNDFTGPDGVRWYGIMASDQARIDRRVKVYGNDEAEIDSSQAALEADPETWWLAVSGNPG